MFDTLGTYPCFGYKNALTMTIPGANSRQVGEPKGPEGLQL